MPAKRKIPTTPTPEQPENAGSPTVKLKRAAGGLRTSINSEQGGLRVFRGSLRSAPMIERVEIERRGVSYEVVQDLIAKIGVTSGDFQRYTRVAKSTFNKAIREKSAFTGTAGQSVVGFVELINKVEDMLAAEQNNAEAGDFNVEKWVGAWIQRPQPALGGRAPAELMDTPTGRASVMRVLGAIQSGAYQ